MKPKKVTVSDSVNAVVVEDITVPKKTAVVDEATPSVPKAVVVTPTTDKVVAKVGEEIVQKEKETSPSKVVSSTTGYKLVYDFETGEYVETPVNTAQDSVPAAKPTLVVEPIPAAKPVPAAEPTLVVEPTPAAEPTLVVEPTPAAEPTLVVEPTPTAEPTPAAEPTPVAEPTPAAKRTFNRANFIANRA